MRRFDGRFRNLRVAGAAHRFRKTDQFGLLPAASPIVAVITERDNPLISIGAIKEDTEPPLEPATRPERARLVNVGSLIKQHRDVAIDVVRERNEIDIVQILPWLDV